jgi:hypothetical protein
MKVKDLGASATKFSTNAAAGSTNYKNGVSANSDWAGNTAAAESTYAAGVQAAVASQRFSKGVNKAGQQKWQANTISKGQARFQQAVATPQAQQAWQAGFGPYAQVLGSITVPPKGVKGSPGNYAIVQQIGDALHKAKVG